MSDIKPTKEGRVNIPLGPARLKELSALAKKHGTNMSGLGRALILEGIERVKSGQLEITSGVILTPKQ